MANGRQLENAVYGVTTDWKDEVESKNLIKIGLNSLEFSNWGASVAPEIVAGSNVDIEGIMYYFDSNLVVTGTPPGSGEMYIRVYDDAGEAVAEYTTDTLPDYDFLRKGYYESNKRWVLRLDFDFINEVMIDNNFYIYEVIDTNAALIAAF